MLIAILKAIAVLGIMGLFVVTMTRWTISRTASTNMESDRRKLLMASGQSVADRAWQERRDITDYELVVINHWMRQVHRFDAGLPEEPFDSW